MTLFNDKMKFEALKMLNKTLTKFNVECVQEVRRSLIEVASTENVVGRAGGVGVSPRSHKVRARAAHARTDARTTDASGKHQQDYLKGVGESEPRRGEGSGTAVYDWKAPITNRKAKRLRSSGCACRLGRGGCQ